MPDSGNVFASLPFLASLAAARFPGRPTSVGVHRIAGRDFRLLSVSGGPVTSVPWLDFHEPLAPSDAGSGTVRPLKYLPRAALRTMTVDEWRAARLVAAPGLPSPFIDWTTSPTPVVESQQTRRRWRQLARELPDATFTYQDDDPAAMARCIEWKRAQYRATGVGDALSDPANRRLFGELRERGLLVTSTLRGGGALLAVHVGMEWAGRLYWWIPSYDPAYAAVSPGRVLLERLLAESAARGHREFDFLLGDEGYKWQFATHTRVIGPLGTAPSGVRAARLAKATIRSALRRSPPLWTLLQQVRRRLRDL